MSKMNFKSTLWALAFACAAVSCSDELGEGTGTENGHDTRGGYFMTVNIATDGGSALTKANGEESGDYLEESGKEDMVYDVNVFLISGTDNTADLLGLLNSTNGDVAIAGQGYAEIADGLKPDGGVEPNHDQVEVEMQLTEPIPGETEATYQVFTVVNAGERLTGITTLKSLREHLYSEALWSGTTAAAADNFVMSTHKMTGTAGNSVVTLSAANMDESNPAVTNVYVERLAARIDLKVADELLSGTYETTETGAIANGATFKLTGYTVVNRWNGGSYTFKQVSPTVDDWADALPEATTTYGESDPKKYLGDEKWRRTGSGTSGAGIYNYVIDPKTREKDGTNYMTDSYLNPFKADGDLNNLTSSDWVTDLSGFTKDAFSTIAYTKENTMTVAQQVNGYSTGVIFESEFTLAKDFKVSKYSEGKITETTLGEGEKTILVANHQQSDGTTSKVVYANVKTIAAMAFDGIGTSMTVDMYKGFMDGWSTDPELDNVKSLIAQMKESNKVEAAFKEYLSGIANAKSATWDNVKTNLTYDQFLKSTDGQKLADDGEVDADYIGTLSKDFDVSYYKEGKSYHKFWIRHDDNDNDKLMGVMEFCIVRNNVYQLAVTGIRDVGDPLPFTPGKDDPGTPDENDEVSILVNIFVRDWVKRSNDNIIL